MDISILTQLGGLVWTVASFIVALSIIVAIHEYGHYIVGRWSGIHAEVFSIGFGPVLWARPDRHGTVWQIAAIPFGGYVKFMGDANAASVGADGTVQEMSAAERRRTMPGAPLWARAATVAAGPIFNFILSILVFAGFVLVSGQTSEDPIIGALKPLPPELAVLQTGDEVVSVNGVAVATLGALMDEGRSQDPAPTATYVVRRDGAEQTVEAVWPMLPVVDSLQPRSAAMEAGLEVGDVIRAIDGTPIHAFEELRDIVMGSDGRALELDVWRAGEAVEVTLSPRRMDIPLPEGGFDTRWLIGITGGLFFEPQTVATGFGPSLQYGVDQTGFIITSSLSALWHIMTGEISTCNLSGPIGIAEASGDTASQGVSDFIWFIAVLSTAVGLLNLFPIPVLDGGHLVFFAYEAVTRRPPPPKVTQVLMIFGLGLMGFLLVFGTTQDLFC